MNIVEQVGPDYFTARFSGSMFVGPDGDPHYLSPDTRVDRGHVRCKKVGGNNVITDARLPCDFFQTFQFLAVPPLGWRCWDKGRVLVYMSRQNTSYTRGVTTKNIERAYAPHTSYMMAMGKLDKKKVEAVEATLRAVVKPEYLSMADGVEALNAGRIMAFCNSNNIAVVPENNTNYNIYCGLDRIGSITAEGNITLLPEFEDFNSEVFQ